MLKSLQRLGDDPRDYDGHFMGLDDERADVSGVRPDADYAANCPPASPFEPWKVSPRPPPPHWHWTDKEKVVSSDGRYTAKEDGFRFEDCVIPGPHPWRFDIDDKGVYQVYGNMEGDSDVRRILHTH
jgi:AMP deaminase